MTGGWLADTAAMYGRVFRRAGQLTAGSWPLALLAIGYPMLLAALSSVLGRFGVVGGMMWTAAAAACFSSWLFFLEQIVRGRGRVDLRELPASFGATRRPPERRLPALSLQLVARSCSPRFRCCSSSSGSRSSPS